MSEPRGMSSRVVLPSTQLPVPEASAVTRLTTQVLVPMLFGFGMGSGGPKRQPVRVPVHVPVPQSESLRHAAPARVPPTHAGYSGSAALAEVQFRLVMVVPLGEVGPKVRDPVDISQAVTA